MLVEKMKIYVSGSSLELGRVSDFMDDLESIGYNCSPSRQWVDRVRNCVEVTLDIARDAMIADLVCIDKSDIVVLLYPNQPTIRAWFECGYALMRKPVLILGSVPVENVMMSFFSSTNDYEELKSWLSNISMNLQKDPDVIDRGFAAMNEESNASK